MGKRIKVKRSVAADPQDSNVPVVEELEGWTLGSGSVVTSGDLLKVNHISFGTRWVELPLKRITLQNGRPQFHFYHSPPGTITVLEERVKVPKAKKTRKIRITPTKENN